MVDSHVLVHQHHNNEGGVHVVKGAADAPSRGGDAWDVPGVATLGDDVCDVQKGADLRVNEGRGEHRNLPASRKALGLCDVEPGLKVPDERRGVIFIGNTHQFDVQVMIRVERLCDIVPAASG